MIEIMTKVLTGNQIDKFTVDFIKFTLAEIKILDYKGFDLVTNSRAIYDTIWVSKIGTNKYLKSIGDVDVVITNLNDLL